MRWLRDLMRRILYGSCRYCGRPLRSGFPSWAGSYTGPPWRYCDNCRTAKRP